MFLNSHTILICIDNSSTTSISKADEINRLREIDDSQEDRSQKVSIEL